AGMSDVLSHLIDRSFDKLIGIEQDFGPLQTGAVLARPEQRARRAKRGKFRSLQKRGHGPASCRLLYQKVALRRNCEQGAACKIGSGNFPGFRADLISILGNCVRGAWKRCDLQRRSAWSPAADRASGRRPASGLPGKRAKSWWWISMRRRGHRPS